MKIYCICGAAQHGKDTTASFMKEIIESTTDKKVLIAHYGDLLKYICEKFFDWDGKKDEAGRSLLQYIGTEKVRTKNPDYWVDFIVGVLNLFPNEWDYVLMADVRFFNEIRKLRQCSDDVHVIKVIRENFDNGLTDSQKNHVSEHSLQGLKPSVKIMNNGTLDDLKEKIKELISHEEELTQWERRMHILEL